MKRNDRSETKQYPRMVRVNELLREILADALERLDVAELAFVTVIGVECAADLRHATVFFDSPGGAETDAEVIEAFEEVRVRLQRAIARQARLKNTPELRFEADPAVRAGEHIDAVLRDVAVSRQAEAPLGPETR